MKALPALRTRDLVLNFFPPERRSRAIAKSLALVFENFIDAADLTTRLDAFAELKDWITNHAPSPADHGFTRLDLVLALMESESELRSRFERGMRQILTEIRSVELFAEAGLHPREGLLSEAWRRLIERVLPSAREDTDALRLVHRLYPTSQPSNRLIDLPDATFERIARLISPVNDAIAWDKQRDDLTQAFTLLGVHVAGIGLSPALRARSRTGPIDRSPFHELQQTAVELVRQRGGALALQSWRGHVQRCREELAYVHLRFEETGVSTALVFDMGTIEHAISRMENIASVLFVEEEQGSVAAVKRLFDDVLKSQRSDTSLLALFRENSALMARKVVERTGKAGEPYIARSRSEYRGIWRASLGGGLLTVLTSALKMRIVGAHLPLFLTGMAAGTNYALSFILLQHFHLALATKQPSVTAATFAGIVRVTHGQARLERLVEFIRRITRSQLASAVGNLLAVSLGGLVFAELWALAFSEPFLEVRSARYVYETLNPLASGTAIYAALTGVILWVSALAGGWLENFATFNHLPQAIAHHPLGRKLGRERMKRLADTVAINLSGWTTSIVLGYLLGFVPVVGEFFGIPLDVRHVTLSTGTVTLAAASFGNDWFYRGWLIHTVFGIAVTFVLNLGVSFSIAASIALRAYGVPWQDQLALLRYVFRSFLSSPGSFLLPPLNQTQNADYE